MAPGLSGRETIPSNGLAGTIRGFNEVRDMFDFLYILVGALFFVGCWAFTKACDRL
jgi:hypothetical protein